MRDWEHLPWLHASSFRSIELEDAGEWGWRARIGLHGSEDIRLELVIDGERYVSRTLEGPGARGEIWTTVAPQADHETDIEVEFRVPDVSAEHARSVGDAFLRLYTQLWDEDEAMMRTRAAELERRGAMRAEAVLDLGTVTELEARAPCSVDFHGRRFRIVRDGEEWLVHSAVCPHWLGPLETAPEGGEVTCPWHGYRFDVRTGRRCDAESPMRLAPPPRLERDGERVRLVAG